MPFPTILDAIGRTPLVRLLRVAAGSPHPVLGKCEHLNPGGSLKDRIALAMVEDAERSGKLRPGATIVEATGGNTGVGLALVAAVRGYRLVCVLPEKMSHDKRRALRLLGAEVIVTKDAPPEDPDNFRNLAERLAAERGWYPIRQFENPANVAIHEETTATELLEQTGGRIGAFVAGVGTGGCITGVGRVLKRELGDQVVIALADPIGSKLAGIVRDGCPTPDAKYQLEGMGGSCVPKTFDPSVVDVVLQVGDEEAFATTLRLVREEGLLVGGSSGAVVAAALRVAALPQVDGPVVAILADSWDRYWSKPWMDAPGALARSVPQIG